MSKTRLEIINQNIIPEFHEFWKHFSKNHNLTANEEYYILSKYCSERSAVQVALDICRSWQLTDEEVDKIGW